MRLWRRIAVVAAILACLAVAVFVDWRRRQPAERPEPAPVADCVMDALRLIAKLETAGTSPSNVVGRIFDARGKTAADFRRALESLPGHSRHVWMPGADQWLLVGHLGTNGVPLAKAMEDFAALESARYSPTELFACYVGTVDEVMPAFSSDLRGELLPEWFVSKDIPYLGWLDARGIDPDIRGRIMGEMRSMQVVRRLVIEGDLLAAEGKADDATEVWARAMLRNPRDPMLLDRLDKLSRNAEALLAVGNVAAAAKCYETMVVINPTDASAVLKYGMSLRRLGKKEMSDQVLKRAGELRKK